MKTIIILISLFLINFVSAERWRRQDSCYGPDARPGTCKGLEQCPVLRAELLEKRHDPEYAEFLKLSNEICSEDPSNPIVCCPSESTRVTPDSDEPDIPDKPDEPDEPHVQDEPDEPDERNDESDIVTRFPPPLTECGSVNNTLKRIVGGEPAKKGAWPWVVLLGYEDPLSESPFKCGGALITKKHVLTAAHCIRSNLKFVRLGEHDLDTDKEARHVDIKVAKAIKHPAYTKGHNDIAVLVLEKSVKFTRNIKPICLPITPEARNRSYVDHNPFVAGWGKTLEDGKSSNVLIEIQIPVHENQVCKDLYTRQDRFLSYRKFDDAIICAGVLKGGKDACQGDSGGPLMMPQFFNGTFVYSAIGIVSYGIGCARRDIPGVYSNVAHFMDWIEENVIES